MVQGTADLRRRFKAIPEVIRKELVQELETIAAQIVSEMNSLKPLAEIQISWTWGDAPKGSVKIGSVRGKKYGKLSITIYAVGDTFAAHWFEFGTAERFHKSGKSVGRITASPFFYPVYRANKSRAKSRLSRAVTRALKKA